VVAGSCYGSDIITIYYISPIFGFFLSLLVWFLVLYLSGFISFEFVFFLACTRLGVYTVIIAGWSSNSGYSLFWGVFVLLLKLFLMKLDWLFFCFLLLFWFVDIIWLIFIFFKFICG
jgi:NADH-ubiquinone oxidoreductase chain 1